MSNGMYESIERQAVTNMHKDRISVAMFYSPGKNTEVGPAPEIIDELHPCQYKRFIFGDYLQHFLSNKFDGKKKIEFAKIIS
ncbi:hypothetical protein SUGI_0545490 [Cryptomeria japonica]|nr:hypothetical protein SUGI_0545490 [Cryptomeria japonica]